MFICFCVLFYQKIEGKNVYFYAVVEELNTGKAWYTELHKHSVQSLCSAFLPWITMSGSDTTDTVCMPRATKNELELHSWLFTIISAKNTST